MMVPVVVGVVGAAVLSVVVWLVERRHRAVPIGSVRVELCCRCNAEIVDDEIHTVAETAADDASVIDGPLMGGGTGMSADFCAEHCPIDGCRHPTHANLAA